MPRIEILAPGETKKARDNARGHIFEAMIADVLARLGHTIDEINQSQSGGEIDIVCHSIIGAVRCVSECKARARPISVGDLKKFRSTYVDLLREDPSAVAVMVSLGGFGRDALAYFRREIEVRYPHFQLYDGARVYELLLTAGVVSTCEEVARLVSERTSLHAEAPILIRTASDYYWATGIRSNREDVARRFVLTDAKGAFLRDLAMLSQLERFVIDELRVYQNCTNGAFPEPSRRALLSETGTYFGLRGRYRFPARRGLRDVLRGKNPILHSAVTALFPAKVPGRASVWQVHCQETERLIDALIPDEIKEDMFASELAALIAAVWLHLETHEARAARAIEDHAREVALSRGPETGDLESLIDAVRGFVSRIHEPFGRTRDRHIVGLEAIDADFLVACVRLACHLDLAFFRSPETVYATLEPHVVPSDSVFRLFDARGLLLDYNDHRIIVDVTCSNPETHLVLLRLGDAAQAVLDEVEPVLYERGIRFLRLDTKIERHGYDMVGCRFEAHTESMVNLLMGRALYGTADVAVRELVQNALDAVLTHSYATEPGYQPEIEVRLRTVDQGRALEVSDNGCGMDRYIVQKYLSAVGKSFWRSQDFKALTGGKGESNGPQPVGQFGIGVLSAFMIGDQMVIETRTDEAPPVRIEIPGIRDYFVVTQGSRRTRGTCLSLRLKEDIDVAQAIQKYVLRPHCPITFVDITGASRTLQVDSRRLWERLNAPASLSGRGKHLGQAIPIRGTGFNGELLIVVPGASAKLSGDSLCSVADEMAKAKQQGQGSRRRYYGSSRDKGSHWSEGQGIWALLQSGMLVQEGSFEKEKDTWQTPTRKTIGIEPKWCSTCWGYIDCQPGILELTASRKELVDGNVPSCIKEAIDGAKAAALGVVRDWCDRLWGKSELNRPRDRINTIIDTLRGDRFPAQKGPWEELKQPWEELLKARYSLAGILVKRGLPKAIIGAAEEMKRIVSKARVPVFSLRADRVREWADVLTGPGARDAAYIASPPRGMECLARHMECRDIRYGGEYDALLSEAFDLTQKHSLDAFLPGYCGLYEFRRPAFDGVVLDWGARGWCVQRAQAADVTRAEFLGRASVSPARRAKLPRLMFNANHPLLRLAEAVAASRDSGSQEPVKRLLLAAVRLIEAPGKRQKAALMDELKAELSRCCNNARKRGVNVPADACEVTLDDFAKR